MTRSSDALMATTTTGHEFKDLKPMSMHSRRNLQVQSSRAYSPSRLQKSTLYKAIPSTSSTFLASGPQLYCSRRHPWTLLRQLSPSSPQHRLSWHPTQGVAPSFFSLLQHQLHAWGELTEASEGGLVIVFGLVLHEISYISSMRELKVTTL
ncbi:hypothetical protein [Phaffia rhodozyma]|uniref:Uncharacterized protein n=1 Tax=Phaffia rhodozyma TaxID=264483 RepID=A0A0F7SI77_PHARH|nr:hypothetical protein [Phaffia rhodozyma]